MTSNPAYGNSRESSTKLGSTTALGGSAPAYLQIAHGLRAQIRQGELLPGWPLPSERELCAEFGVSRMTARNAVLVLEREGLVFRNANRGTFVSEPRLALRLGSFSHEVAGLGMHPGADVIWSREVAVGKENGAGRVLSGAETAAAAALESGDVSDGSAGGDLVLAGLQRLRRSDDEPIALETTYFRAGDVAGLLDGDLSGSLWDVLASDFGIKVARSEATLEVVPISAANARVLGVREGGNGILLTRRSFDPTDRCVEYAEDIYRADRVSLRLDRSYE